MVDGVVLTQILRLRSDIMKLPCKDLMYSTRDIPCYSIVPPVSCA